ncbi:MAG: SBBP repeat-containing protein [Chitinophagales bacterium]|nr:SBBP repeat-containing protein [Chitinophagales bacterium]MDW8427821.1 SBBP repeat-containing protein [Chitinophagales bacterium]
MNKFCGVVLTLASLSVFAVSVAAQQSFKEAMYAAGFRKNLGQIKNQYGEVNGEVLYMYSADDFNLQLKKNSFSYELFQIINHFDYSEDGLNPRYEEDRFYALQAATINVARIDVVLEGANPNPEIITSEENGTVFHYYLNLSKHEPVRDVPCYDRILYRNIYPNIDLLFIAGPSDQDDAWLRYEWIIYPGGNPSDIRMLFQGVHAFNLRDDGSLDLITSRGFVREGAPYTFVYASGQALPCTYKLNGPRLTYDLAAYDPSQTIVIDPTLVWGTFYGGENEETIFESEVVVDKNNKIILTGSTYSTTGIATEGAWDVTYKNKTDIFICKFKENGKIAWGTYFGEKGKDGPFGLTLDKDNNIYVYGSSDSDTGMATAGAYKTKILESKGDMLLSKWKPKGELIWSTYYGGESREHWRNGIVTDDYHIIIGGWTNSETGIATPGAYQTVAGNNGDAVLGRFDANGWPVWVTYWSGDGDDRAHELNFDIDKTYFLVAGTCESTTNFIKNSPWQKTKGSLIDAFLAKWDVNGNYLWGTYIGGNKDDRGRGVVVDAQGNIYVSGYTQSVDSISSPGAHQENWGGGYSSSGIPNDDAFLMKFTNSGQFLWGTYYGGDKTEFCRGMDIDANGNLYIIGDAQSTSNIGTPNGFMPEKQPGSTSDAMFAKWNSDGQLQWGSYLGSDKPDEGDDVQIYANNQIVLAVETRGELPVTADAYQFKNAGAADVLLYRFHSGNSCFDLYEDANDDYNKNSPELKAYNSLNTNVYGWSAVIDGPTDQDYFKVKTKASEPNYMFILDKLTVNYDLAILNKKGNQIGVSSNPGTTADTVVLNNLAQGSYYIKIVHDGINIDTVNCYRLRVYKSSSAFPTRISVQEALTETTTATDLFVYPNPVQHQMIVRFIARGTAPTRITIYDLLERIVYQSEEEIAEGYAQVVIATASLQKGAYVLLVENGGYKLTQPFVKQ